jgi:hypothetical protein
MCGRFRLSRRKQILEEHFPNRIDADGHSFNGGNITASSGYCGNTAPGASACITDVGGGRLKMLILDGGAGMGDDAPTKVTWDGIADQAQNTTAPQQNETSAPSSNSNAANEQHQYDLVVERTNKLLGTTDASDHIDPDGHLVGGNYEFAINNNDKSDATFRSTLNNAMGEAEAIGGRILERALWA